MEHHGVNENFGANIYKLYLDKTRDECGFLPEGYKPYNKSVLGKAAGIISDAARSGLQPEHFVSLTEDKDSVLLIPGELQAAACTFAQLQPYTQTTQKKLSGMMATVQKIPQGKLLRCSVIPTHVLDDNNVKQPISHEMLDYFIATKCYYRIANCQTRFLVPYQSKKVKFKKRHVAYGGMSPNIVLENVYITEREEYPEFGVHAKTGNFERLHLQYLKFSLELIQKFSIALNTHITQQFKYRNKEFTVKDLIEFALDFSIEVGGHIFLTDMQIAALAQGFKNRSSQHECPAYHTDPMLRYKQFTTELTEIRDVKKTIMNEFTMAVTKSNFCQEKNPTVEAFGKKFKLNARGFNCETSLPYGNNAHDKTNAGFYAKVRKQICIVEKNLDELTKYIPSLQSRYGRDGVSNSLVEDDLASMFEARFNSICGTLNFSAQQIEYFKNFRNNGLLRKLLRFTSDCKYRIAHATYGRGVYKQETLATIRKEIQATYAEYCAPPDELLQILEREVNKHRLFNTELKLLCRQNGINLNSILELCETFQLSSQQIDFVKKDFKNIQNFLGQETDYFALCADEMKLSGLTNQQLNGIDPSSVANRFVASSTRSIIMVPVKLKGRNEYFEYQSHYPLDPNICFLTSEELSRYFKLLSCEPVLRSNRYEFWDGPRIDPALYEKPPSNEFNEHASAPPPSQMPEPLNYVAQNDAEEVENSGATQMRNQ